MVAESVCISGQALRYYEAGVGGKVGIPRKYKGDKNITEINGTFLVFYI